MASKGFLYPTAKDFDDLFSESKIAEDCPRPEVWVRDWVIDIEDFETSLPKLGYVGIGPFCNVREGRPLWVKARDHLVNSIKDTLVVSKAGAVYFDILHKDGEDTAVVLARYSDMHGYSTIRSKPLARILWKTVPFQGVISRQEAQIEE